MLGYRVADARHPIYDATGATLHGGRWNSVGVPVIYAASTYAGALLEVLVHANLSQPPKNHRSVRISIPGDLSIETVSLDSLPDWDAEHMTISRQFGDRWVRENRGAVLRVPSVITRDREMNLVLNPAHPDFSRIQADEPEIIIWDARLFRPASSDK